MDCGPACLKMICSYFGNEISMDYIRSISIIDRTGTSVLGLVKAGEKLGLELVPMKSSLQDLIAEKPFPSIVFWKQKHYMVLYKYKNDKFTLSDPAFGSITMSTAEFLTGWASKEGLGIYVSCYPTTAFYELKSDATAANKYGFRRVFSYLLRYKSSLFQIGTGLFVSTMLQAVFPFLTSLMVDVGISQRDMQFVYLLLIGQLCVFLGKTTVELIRSQILVKLSTKINVNLLKDFYGQLMKLPLSYFDSRKLGDILQRINDHKRVESFLTSGALNTIFSLLSLLIFGMVLAFYSPLIFGAFFIGSVLYILWIFLFMKKRAVLDYKYFTQMSENHEKNYELIVGMQEVRLHNAEIKRRSQWEEIQLKLYHLSIDTLSLKQRQAGGALIINELKNIIITFISVNLVIRDQITLGQLLSISYITGQLNNPILQLIDFFQSLQDARLSISRIEEIHELKPEESKYDNLIKEYSNGDILVKDLWFSYGTAHNYPILQNINLCIPANKTTAIVGSSGSGKTTLLKLLLKIYEPQKGQILIDDFPLDKISHSSWRDNCGVVMQEGFLFNDTVLNNIAVADENPDIKMVIEVAKAANIYDYILELPNGLQTIIGSQGISMSVGQKQRLFIARALYKQPDVLFLDEATSALDAQNEKVITHNLVSMFSGKTIIIVAHRLSTVRHADNIIVLDKGRITEMGNHHQLVEKEGIYYNLVRNQLELGK